MKHLEFTRRRLLAGTGLWLATPALLAAPTPVEMWKSPQCLCCKDWATHLQSNGFSVNVHDEGNASARARLRIALQYGSCHTATVGGYAIEGHVPARDIRRLLAERPKGVGLAVPGMPIGSPGMDGPAYRGRSHAYDVLLLLTDGSARVYQHYA